MKQGSDGGTPRAARRDAREGIALVPVMLVVSGLAIFTMALMTGVLSGNRTVSSQSEEYRLSCSVESVATLAIEAVWSGYLESQGGFAGTSNSLRVYLDSLGIEDSYDLDHPEPPLANEGFDWLASTQLAGDGASFEDTRVDQVRLVRRDILPDATELYVTVVADAGGEGAVQPNRAVQVLYTIEPDRFDGFDYAMLSNNVNCIFCHTQVNSVEKYFGNAPGDGYERVKVGTLESLMLRHDMDGLAGAINDADSDSFVAGTVYTRGSVILHDGTPVSSSDWSDLSFRGFEFDVHPDSSGVDKGYLVEDAWGNLVHGPFDPAGTPPEAFENFYTNYPSDPALMVDGNLPMNFPAPIPDNGGIDPGTGLPNPSAASNRLVDDSEFYDLASTAKGSVSVAKPAGLPGGVLNVRPGNSAFTDIGDYAAALFVGNSTTLSSNGGSVSGNVIMTGSATDPIVLDGTVAIDGDLIINGYVKGEGTLVVRGNVYVPTDLQYLDGREVLEGDDPSAPTGPRTFGVAQDGTRNALGLTAGGNIVVGDYLRPSSIKFDHSYVVPPPGQFISGNPDSGDPMLDLWSFSLAEMSLFNRGEWAKTQQILPADATEAAGPSSGWTATNPGYVADYVPRYYRHGEDTVIPIYNKNVWFDAATATWHGDEEVPIGWDASLLTYVDPSNTSDPVFYNPDGSPRAVSYELQPQGEWVPDSFYKLTVNLLQSTAFRPLGKPLSIDGLMYTNNAIFSIVQRATTYYGRMLMNGAIVAADLGMLAPGFEDPWNVTGTNTPLGNFATGLQLNYDRRVKDLLNVRNPFQVRLKRTLWNPTANLPEAFGP